MLSGVTDALVLLLQSLQPSNGPVGQHDPIFEQLAAIPEGVIKIDPTHSIVFPGVDGIADVAFSADGRTAYCLVNGQSVDIWGAFVSIWPQIAGGITAIVMIIWVLALARVSRRPQVPGAPYCRKCNYNVVSQAPDSVRPRPDRKPAKPGTVCPECGLDLSKAQPRRGRSPERRLAWPTVVALSAIIPYAAFVTGLLNSMPGADRASRWVGIWSSTVDDWADNHKNYFLLQHRIRVTRVLRVDIVAGRNVGPVWISREAADEMRLSPDGSHLVLCSTGHRVSWVSARSGSRRASTFGGVFHEQVVDHPDHLVGMVDDRGELWVYYSVMDRLHDAARLVKWCPRTGDQQVVIDEPAPLIENAFKMGGVRGHEYVLLQWPEGTATLSEWDLVNTQAIEKCILKVREPAERGGKELHTTELGERGMTYLVFKFSSPLTIPPDGSKIFLWPEHFPIDLRVKDGILQGISGFSTGPMWSVPSVCVDLHTGQRLPLHDLSDRELPVENGAIASNVNVFVPDSWRGVRVYSHRLDRWIACLRLAYPHDPQLFGCQTGGWLGAVVPSPGSGSTWRRDKLLLFDLHTLNAEQNPSAETDRPPLHD